MSLGVRDRLPGMPQLFRVTALKELPGYQRELEVLKVYLLRMIPPLGLLWLTGNGRLLSPLATGDAGIADNLADNAMRW